MTVTSPGDDEGAVPGVPRSSETAERLLRIWPVSDGSERELDAGDLLIDAGEESTLVYLVLEGRLEVVGPSGTVAVLEAGSLVGELGAFTGGARSATVRCAAPARVASISADQFGRLLDEHPELAAEVAGEAARRLRETILAEHLGSLFESAGADLLSRLGEMVEWRHLEAGEVLFEQGDPADSAYLVVSGRLRAEVTEPESSRVIGEAGQGELIGEMALLDDATRGATIYATRESDVARLPRTALLEMARSRPEAMLEIVRVLLRRSAKSRSRQPAPEHTVIGVIAVDETVAVSAFVSEVAETLSSHGSCAHFRSDKVDEILHREGVSNAEPSEAAAVRVSQWLDEVEHSHRFLVLEADRDWTPWTRRVVASADHLLLVANAGGDPSPRPVEGFVAAMTHRARPPRRSLVLLHATGAGGMGRRWLQGRPLEEIHHVRQGRIADMRRLARLLAGRGVGLVLGGGGARGFAHLGVMKALASAEIPIDLVGGTSIGSIMATLPAMEVPLDEMVPLVQRQFARLLDYTPPLVSMIAGRRITKSMRDIYDDLAIEDLWLRYFCVSASLTRSVQVVHRSGDLVTALRASVAIPGVLPPVPYGDDLLVDGGALNNLPADEMRMSNPSGIVIAVDVAPLTGPRVKVDYGLSVSGWTAIRHRLGRNRDLPGITAVLLRSSSLGAFRDRDRLVRDGVTDLYLDLKASRRGMLDFENVGSMAQAGYESTVDRIEEWVGSQSTLPW